ncbi:uncharacterized protein EAE98_004418 [Botrytis deweyae]|uniref:Uncharacterized protein n=1 Tax=Botrytis deweyae TaxID=2478750 RepID=A0ABQ7IQT1_9HELO|nr:uncharacterized protein EAE98_004418 [Botrytis deweyae]KAF7931682.1 hypothetical protein EAE98_004418 [Botrytis deweyae]
MDKPKRLYLSAVQPKDLVDALQEKPPRALTINGKVSQHQWSWKQDLGFSGIKIDRYWNGDILISDSSRRCWGGTACILPKLKLHKRHIAQGCISAYHFRRNPFNPSPATNDYKRSIVQLLTQYVPFLTKDVVPSTAASPKIKVFKIPLK